MNNQPGNKLLLRILFLSLPVILVFSTLPIDSKAIDRKTNQKQIDSLFQLLEDNNYIKEDSLRKKGIYLKLADLFIGTRNYALALDYYFRVLKIVDQSDPEKDTISPARLYSELYKQIGICYFNLSNPSKSLSYFQKALETVEENQNSLSDFKKRKLTLLINIGSVYLEQKEFEKARQYFETGLQSDFAYEIKEWRGALYNNLGIVAIEQQKFDKAFNYYQMAYDIRLSLKDTAGMAQVLNN